MGASATENRRKLLLCKAGRRVCGLPLEHVIETMRPLPLEPLAGMPLFVTGLSMVRGVPLPVVSLSKLLGDDDGPVPTRLVTLRVAARGVALSVESVVGVRMLEARVAQDLPLLLQGASSEFVSVVGTLDAELLLILSSGCILSEAAWVVAEAASGST